VDVYTRVTNSRLWLNSVAAHIERSTLRHYTQVLLVLTRQTGVVVYAVADLEET
jgi:hypothetical protein